MPLYGLRLMSPVSVKGGEKYAPCDWRNGQSFSTLFDCMSRHWLEVQERGIWSIDPEMGTYHVAQIAWNVMTMLTFMALGRYDLDDITPWQTVTAAEKKAAIKEAEDRGVDLMVVLREKMEQKKSGS